MTPNVQTDQKVLDLLAEEIKQVLEFSAGPVRTMYRNKLYPNLLSFQTESVGEHAWMTVMIGMSLLELCRARHIEPFKQVDPVWFMLQCLLLHLIPKPILKIEELSAQEAQEIIDKHHRTVMLAAQPVVTANMFGMVLDNLGNTDNPISQLVLLSSYTAELMFYLDNMMTGNQWAYGLGDIVLARMADLRAKAPDTTHIIFDTIDYIFRDIVGEKRE